MKKRVAVVLLLLSMPFGAYAAVDILPGVRYHEATAEVNEKAEAALLKAFGTKKIGDLFGSIVICGPALWHRIKNMPQVTEHMIASTVFNVPVTSGPNSGKMQKLHGALFQRKEEIDALSEVLGLVIKSKIRVRRPERDEISIFWALIPYDIEEPVYVVEAGDLRLLVDISKYDNKVFWIDEVSGYLRN